MVVDPLERIANLYALLRDTRRPVTRTEIMDSVPGYGPDSAATRRQFERDKDALRAMGVTISVERLDASSLSSALGYRIPEASLLPDPGLTEDEERALALAAATIRMSDPSIARALHKVGGAAAGAASGTSVVVKTDPRLPTVQDAIVRRCRLRFTYRGEERTIEPTRLVRANKGRWYVSGFDLVRQAERRFRLDQVDGEFVTASEPGAFDAPEVVSSGSPLPAWMYGTRFVDTVLLVGPDAAEWAIREAGVNVTVERHPDGSATLTVPVANAEAFRGFALSLLDDAVLVSPVEQREALVSWVQAFLEGVSDEAGD